jgi:hypothetical protein
MNEIFLSLYRIPFGVLFYNKQKYLDSEGFVLIHRSAGFIFSFFQRSPVLLSYIVIVHSFV